MSAGKQGFMSRLSAREQVYILAMVLTFFVMATVLLIYLRGQVLRDTRKVIDEHRAAIVKLQTQGQAYQERLEAKAARESSIATEQLLFSTLVEDAQQGLGVSVQDQVEKPLLELGGGLVKRTFEFRLIGATLEDLTKLLVALESERNRIILTESLTLKSTSDQQDRLNADVAISTWERRDIRAEAAGEEPSS